MVAWSRPVVPSCLLACPCCCLFDIRGRWFFVSFFRAARRGDGTDYEDERRRECVTHTLTTSRTAVALPQRDGTAALNPPPPSVAVEGCSVTSIRCRTVLVPLPQRRVRSWAESRDAKRERRDTAAAKTGEVCAASGYAEARGCDTEAPSYHPTNTIYVFRTSTI